MVLFNPKQYKDRNYPDERSAEIMKKTIEFFENKGLAKLKEDFHSREFTYDFAEFVKKERIFETLFLPKGYGEDPNQYYSTYRMFEFSEILGFYGSAYWYMFHVSTLGLDPVLLGDNEEAKHKAAAKLKENPLCAFGLSERTHGADIYSSEVKLYPQADGTYLAQGSKYYIGNGNLAGTVTVFGKIADTDEYVFFVVDSSHEKYECIKNVIAQNQMYVAEFALHDYPITEAEILSRGQKAWDDMLNTINICKFNIGSASIGLCEHSLYETLNHAAKRKLFGKYVTEFAHIQQLFFDSWCRIVGMKLFGLRATDYLRAANPEDRRYLLFNPIMKMKVAIQGEQVTELLWDILAARGFEKDMFFEQAAVEIKGMPKLEGTKHVNMALIAKLIPNYIFNPKEYPEVPKMNGGENDDFLFNQGPTKGYGKIQFHDYMPTFKALSHLPNAVVFMEQIEAFKEFLMGSGMDLMEQMKNFDFLYALGECFAMVPYAQLICESAKMEGISDDILDSLFDVFVRDMSRYAMDLAMKQATNEKQQELCTKMYKKPVVNMERYNRIIKDEIYSLVDAYHMNP
ncbi:acyl-CoA dehydrogenase family protein [Desulfobotulus mexicanus]|uniref:Acyl-CoA dehydrogenase n=1 Tax=Desulfobotulus mexicanus TaxID=2586642 RepID=A0A5S5MCH9_9BACT|nr:acyl-CoA dehydrogenase family protein [Desulfobotulus mexicanus]TYT73436.1 acyl-CoA dehydrogenase [Desulfobotulus mexicanus]